MTFSSPNDIIKSTHAIDAKGGRLPIGIPGRLQIGMHGRLRRYPHAGDPRRIFDAASALVDAFELMDQALANVLDSKLKTLMVLEDVDSGSLKVWLKNLLSGIPDESIKDLEWKKAVGHYLVKAKYLILEFCNDESGG